MTMKNILILLFCLLYASICFAQKRQSNPKEQRIPLAAEKWNFDSQKTEFTSYKNVPVIKLKGSKAELKDFVFINGTIEFDVEPSDAEHSPFVTMYFRYQNEKENECFYLRVGRENNLQRNDAVQYAPFVDGVNLWDILPHYQGPAQLNNKDWNHIKLVISGLQMRAFVNNLEEPALQIPRLEGNVTKGSVVFEGLAAFANLVIKPEAIDDLSSKEGIDLTGHDANYIRNWRISSPQPLPKGREVWQGDYPKDENAVWESITAERLGLINVTRKFGRSESRRFVFLKTKIKSVTQKEVKVDFGFSDEAWVFINGSLAYADKNLYVQTMRKYPDGRLSIDNSSFIIPLRQGDNELVIALANDFYGWGIIARLQEMEGIEFTRE